MSEREIRTVLAEVIDDIDQGRVKVDRPRRMILAGPLLAAAIGLGACQTQTKSTTQKQKVVQVDAGSDQAMQPRPMDMGPVPEYAAPEPANPMKVDMGPTPEYAAPAPSNPMKVDMGVLPAYKVPAVEPRPMDMGPTPEYAAPAPK